MIQFVIGAVAGIAANKYFTKERVEKIKETVIDISANKIKSCLDKIVYGDDRPNHHKHVETHVFDTRTEAIEALDYLRDTIKDYGYASINDYYDTFKDANMKQTYTNERYGWFNLDEVKIEHVPVPNGWVLVLPEPVSIDQFTEENPPCQKELEENNTNIEKKVIDTYDKNTAFDVEKNIPDMPAISFPTKAEAKRAMWLAMGSIDDHKYISYYDLSTAFKPNKTEYVGTAKYGWTDKNSFLVYQKLGDNRWYITIDKATKLPEYLLYSENMRKVK
jgi:hypothetical protein